MSMDEQKQSPRQPYEKPTVKVYGTVRTLTHSQGTSPSQRDRPGTGNNKTA